uniref:Innexin n=1 Tax=Macrostomum lignano TaxID=282301 RepID=A0A1I8GJJ5_9PLAT
LHCNAFLPINHFVEKVYVFLWFWYIILGVLTLLSTIIWMLRILIPGGRVAYIKQYLRAMKLISNTEDRDCKRFVANSLGPDGGFILQAPVMDATFMWKLSKLGRIGSSRQRVDDDFADRLNYQFSGVILFLFIGLIGIRQYVGKPIQCWIPQEFTRGWEEYAENYCWVANTYYASLEADHLPEEQSRSRLTITYYQWAPIVLAVQALMFYIPCLIWRLFMNYSGFNVRRLLQMAADANVVIPEALNKNVRFMARYMEGCIYRQREYKRGLGVRVRRCLSACSCICCGKRHGNFLVVLYFFVKLLYLLNAFGQLYLMEKFVGTTHTFFGFRVLLDILQGVHWYRSSNFPRVTFCDLQARKIGVNYRYTLQCVLPLNMFLEKIYVFLWFWVALVSVITMSSFVSWFCRMAFARRRTGFVRKYLKIMNALKDTDRLTSRKFVENYLRVDGVFILRLVSANCGDIVAGDLACELWSIYRHKRLQELEDTKLDAAACCHHDLPRHATNNNTNVNSSTAAAAAAVVANIGNSNNNGADENIV